MFEEMYDSDRPQKTETRTTLCSKQGTYPLHAIIALQKALEDGVPEELADDFAFTRQELIPERRRVPRPAVTKIEHGPGRMRFVLVRIWRRLLAAIITPPQASAEGSSVRNGR